jgi:hypothetical protein
MSLLRSHPRPGSRADGLVQPAPEWEQEWRDADAVDREERAAAQRRSPVAALVGAALLAGLADAILPLTPGFSPSDTFGAVAAAAAAAALAVAVVLLARAVAGPAARGGLLFAVALSSVGAAAIHLAVAKDHFEEYALFGLFFVGSGIAQLAWSVWVLQRPRHWLLALGAVGNALIVALWAVDRVWGLPLGPEHWEPEPIGFGDTATSAFELVVVAGCLALLARARPRPLGVRATAALAVAAICVTALGLLSVLGVGTSVLTPTA